MAAKKGNSYSPGRPKGSKDKLARNLKERVLDVAAELEASGKGLAVEADKNPKWFFENFLKPMLPKNIEANVNFLDKLQPGELESLAAALTSIEGDAVNGDQAQTH